MINCVLFFFTFVSPKDRSTIEHLLTQHSFKIRSVLFILRVCTECKQQNIKHFVVVFCFVFGAKLVPTGARIKSNFIKLLVDCLSSRHFVSMNMSMTWIAMCYCLYTCTQAQCTCNPFMNQRWIIIITYNDFNWVSIFFSLSLSLSQTQTHTNMHIKIHFLLPLWLMWVSQIDTQAAKKNH